VAVLDPRLYRNPCDNPYTTEDFLLLYRAAVKAAREDKPAALYFTFFTVAFPFI